MSVDIHVNQTKSVQINLEVQYLLSIIVVKDNARNRHALVLITMIVLWKMELKKFVVLLLWHAKLQINVSVLDLLTANSRNISELIWTVVMESALLTYALARSTEIVIVILEISGKDVVLQMDQELEFAWCKLSVMQ